MNFILNCLKKIFIKLKSCAVLFRTQNQHMEFKLEKCFAKRRPCPSRSLYVVLCNTHQHMFQKFSENADKKTLRESACVAHRHGHGSTWKHMDFHIVCASRCAARCIFAKINGMELRLYLFACSTRVPGYRQFVSVQNSFRDHVTIFIFCLLFLQIPKTLYSDWILSWICYQI
jgi:hypothetical protein